MSCVLRRWLLLLSQHLGYKRITHINNRTIKSLLLLLFDSFPIAGKQREHKWVSKTLGCRLSRAKGRNSTENRRHQKIWPEHLNFLHLKSDKRRKKAEQTNRYRYFYNRYLLPSVHSFRCSKTTQRLQSSYLPAIFHVGIHYFEFRQTSNNSEQSWQLRKILLLFFFNRPQTRSWCELHLAPTTAITSETEEETALEIQSDP